MIFIFIFLSNLAFAQQEEILFKEGLNFYNQGKYDIAIKLFSEVLQKAPNYPNIEEIYVSSIKKKAESMKKAISQERVKKKVEMKLESPIPLRYEPFRDELEIKEPETRTAILPEEDDYLFARRLISLGFIDEGIKEIEKLLKKKSPISDKMLLTIASAYFEKKEYDKASEVINKLLKEYPKTVLKYEGEFLLSDCFFQKKDYRNALIGYMKIREIKGTITDPYPTIPPTLRENDELLADSQFMIGNCYKELGDYQMAIAEYKKVLDEYPKQKVADDACFYIADLYDRYLPVRDFYNAVKFYGRLILEYPNSIWYKRAVERKKHIEENYL